MLAYAHWRYLVEVGLHGGHQHQPFQPSLEYYQGLRQCFLKGLDVMEPAIMILVPYDG